MSTDPGQATAQAVRILDNIRTLLRTAGGTLDEETPGLRVALAQAETLLTGAIVAPQGDSRPEDCV